ncbi:hypothetical protein LV79_002445 [Actinokineospora globicatena]|nr:hypothetical protein [Actinokineospora globicatena]
MMTQVLALAAGGLAATGLRLWWQARRDHRRQTTLRALAERLPHAATVEIHDIRDDGSRLHVRVTPR